MMSYLRDPAEIYRRSFAAIRAEADLSALPASLQDVAVRMIHACGMTDIIGDLRWSADFAERACEALAKGARVVTDARMVADGIVNAELRASGRILCVLDRADAGDESTTRSAAAIARARDDIAGAVVAIGNAPTALFRLLELIDEGAARPATIIGLPVGFVGAVESKAALAADSRGVPFLTLLGRRGGSAMAAAAVNALTLRGSS